MTLVDSIDSVLMLYSYSGFPEHSWAIFEKRTVTRVTTESEPAARAVMAPPLPPPYVTEEPEAEPEASTSIVPVPVEASAVAAPPPDKRLGEPREDGEGASGIVVALRTASDASGAPSTQPMLKPNKTDIKKSHANHEIAHHEYHNDIDDDEQRKRQLRVKQNTMSGLSIVLTLMSILVAFRYDSFTLQKVFSSLMNDDSNMCFSLRPVTKQHIFDHHNGSNRG